MITLKKQFLWQVQDIARRVRLWTEQYDDRWVNGPTENLCGLCAISAAQMSRELTKADIDHVICVSEGEDSAHAFVTVNDHVVDVTATQFSEFVNEPVVIMHTKVAEQHDFYQAVRFFEDVRSLVKYQRASGWPREQIARLK